MSRTKGLTTRVSSRPGAKAAFRSRHGYEAGSRSIWGQSFGFSFVVSKTQSFGFGFSFGFVTTQVQNFTLRFLDPKLKKLNIFHFQIMFACIFDWMSINSKQSRLKKGIYNSWEASGLWLQLHALKKPKLRLRLQLRLQLRAFKKSKLWLHLQLRDLIKASASLRLRILGLRTHICIGDPTLLAHTI